MSQRDSGYTRIERDAYQTPEWVTLALVPHIPKRVNAVLEPAAGEGKMARELENAGYKVFATDIDRGEDFLEYPAVDDWPGNLAIITNPPYELATEFIDQALAQTCNTGFVGMLLRTDFNHAKGRKNFFNRLPFAKKLDLTTRIRWFEESNGAPSFYHSWFMWDWQHTGPAILVHHYLDK